MTNNQISNKQKYINEEFKRFKAVTPMTPMELKEAIKWVKSGNSIHSNPYLWYSEDGWEMNFIDAIRFENDF